ncbi:MAG TPA: hypothetical protein VFV46_08540 [Lacibacter sp.]|nr:hypothetical protein [Lacibacter sp.]
MKHHNTRMITKSKQFLRQAAVVVFLLCLLTVLLLETKRYSLRLLDRMSRTVAMITRHKEVHQSYKVTGNIVFIANSSFDWIFPPTDFNYYFFVTQNRLNRLSDTVFNASLLAPYNIRLTNRDDRQRFDTHVYWENEDVRRFLYARYKVVSFKDLNQIDPLAAIEAYVKEKNAGYILTDEANKMFFKTATVVATYPANVYPDSCFDYHLLNDIYLLKIN